ncbi:MAG TPA: hypothetical protein VLI92_02480 [Candidatus Saccharimonadales bacterium]|nr:hypothetical protein [Candidatus Saccharimonadales bacterium]
MSKNILNQQKGQALLFVIVAMTLALAVGINVSVNTLSTVSRTSNTDTASRALAAAEGGAEQFIVIPTSTLSTLTATCNGSYGANNASVPASCVVKFDTNLLSSDNIKAQAVITVQSYNTNKANGYEVTIKKDNLDEVDVSTLAAASLDFCWLPTDNAKPSDLYFIVYKKDGTLDIKKGFKGAVRPALPYSPTGFTTANAGNGGYHDCATLTGYSTGNIKRLRVYSLQGDSKVEFLSTVLPTQGYKITSFGQLINNGKITASKTVIVYRSIPYLPGAFDAGIYTLGDLN